MQRSLFLIGEKLYCVDDAAEKAKYEASDGDAYDPARRVNICGKANNTDIPEHQPTPILV